MPDTNDTINYGGKDVTALQITTGLYPSTATSLDIRETVASYDILGSHTNVGCKIYPGLRIYVEDTGEIVTVIRQVSGTDGTKWDDWVFDKILSDFKADIRDCHNQIYGNKYRDIKTDAFTTQNLLNYLYIKTQDVIATTHTLTINYVYADHSHETTTATYEIREGSDYSIVTPTVYGYKPDKAVVSGTMQYTDITETVTYSIGSYALTYYVDGVSYATYSVQYQTAVSPTYVPQDPVKSGYTFTGWSYTPELLTPGNLMPGEDTTAEARFEEIVVTYTVTATVSPSGYGTVTGAGTYDKGSTVTLTAVPASGYKFVKWSVEYDIDVNPGYNDWFIFPATSSQSIETAMMGFDPTDGDVIMSSQESTTYYDGYGWWGTLETLEPGTQYRYVSQSNDYWLWTIFDELTTSTFVINNLQYNTAAKAYFAVDPMVKVAAWTSQQMVVFTDSVTTEEYIENALDNQDNYIEVPSSHTNDTYRTTFATTGRNQFLIIAIPTAFSTGDGNDSGSAKFYTGTPYPGLHGYVAELPCIDNYTLTVDGVPYSIYETNNIKSISGTQVLFGDVKSDVDTTFEELWDAATDVPSQS